MIVRDVMSKDPVTADESTTVREAIELLFTLEVRHLPVTSGGQLVGIVSDRDVRQLTVPISWNESVIAEDSVDADLLEQPVTAVMSGGIISVEPDTKVTEVIDVICEQRVGALPVVDSGGAVVGMISYVDLLRALRPAD